MSPGPASALRIALVTLIPLVASSCARVESDPFTAEQLIAKITQALGGADSLRAIESMVLDGHYVEPGHRLLIPAKVQKQRPHFRVIGDVAGLGFAEGFDGASWEYQRGKATRSTGEAEAATRRGAEFDYPFIDWAAKGHRVALLPPVDVAGTTHHALRVTLQDGWALEYWIHPVSFLPVLHRKAMPLHAVGEPIDYLVTSADWRRVNGVLMPFAIIERSHVTGAMISATIYDSVRVNVPLDRAIFSPPVTR